jgi:quinol monooxygenase YgiN
MLIRIVRMTFREGQTEAFLSIFSQSKENIRQFPGCLHLELWQDIHQPYIYSTYSHWESEAALNAYRQSELFTATWAQTKVLFSDKPQVFSMQPTGK